jgi:acetyl-CoA carboxylase biotin carboxylase subunit
MKVLVANRGEIAVRVFRACRDLGWPSVAVYSEGDREALHTRYADEAWSIGPTPASESYLNISAVIDAARRSEAEAVHPGYGFLSESAEFAAAVEDAGLVFVGPRSKTLEQTGDKLTARAIARNAGLPVLSGPDEPLNGPVSHEFAEGLIYPILVKAVAGGGGRGIRLVSDPAALPSMVAAAQREAKAAFGDGGVYFESLVTGARHIEVQIVGDGVGRVLCLGERECSIQRRRQKLIEESPAPGLSDEQRAFLYEAAARLGEALGYRSLGTVEFLLDDQGDFHFIEINPRIQVEHPVTELVTGLDLVKMQLRLAAGRPLRLHQSDVTLNGAAIEARVLAEDPEDNFMPTTGEITYLKEPAGPGIRVDSALYQGMRVTTDYDSLLAKVIAWGDTRAVTVLRLRRALREFQIGGVATDVKFLIGILESIPFLAGSVDTTYLESFSPNGYGERHLMEREVAAAAALLTHRRGGEAATVRTGDHQNSWRTVAWREQM